MTPTNPGLGSIAGQITLRYWAAAAHAAGVDSDVIEVDEPVTLAMLKDVATDLHPSAKFRDVLGCCSVLVGEKPSNGDAAEIVVLTGQTVEFLPPFAGG